MLVLGRLFAVLLVPISLCAAPKFAQADDNADVVKMLHYFTRPAEQGGGSYVGSAGALKNKILPMSYYSSADYWGRYVAQLPGNDCTVKNVYNPGDYTLTPTPDSPGMALQVERVNIFNGTNIYDAATWQIALALGASHGISGPNSQSLFEIADNQNLLLSLGYDGQATPPLINGANRATSHSDGTFTYNGTPIQDPSQAYFFRMIAQNWLATDPFKGTSYQHYIKAEGLPNNPDYQPGKITWLDWKPITGENAWGLLIGPLQAAYLRYCTTLKQAYIPHDTPAVQNALGVLYAFRCMQSPLGGIYYATKGSLGNMGSEPINPYGVSVENNASTLAGLRIFQQVLQDELQNEPTLSSADRTRLEEGLNDIDVLLNGGKTPQGYRTEGLLAFLKTNAWDSAHSIFYQGGLANDPQAGDAWQPTTQPKAVDVSTWTIAVLGQPQMDDWFGFGSAYGAWESVKTWGGFYGPDGQLWGVGYSDQDGNGSSGDYTKGVLSAEWTAGAINLTRLLIQQYNAAAQLAKYTPEQQALAHQYVQQLSKDEKSMIQGMCTLRSDSYAQENAYSSVRPADYSSLISLPEDSLAYVYASKRYLIPFGWYANPLPSTASTAWAIMLHYNYNPFALGGQFSNSR
jgi:hypothetical protein